MANTQIITTTVKITAKDINGNNVAKQFNNVQNLCFDYSDSTPIINIVDQTGSFYFPLTPLTTVTYTITPGFTGSHVILMS